MEKAPKTPRKALVTERKRRQWSQQELATLLRTTQNNVSRWELGITTPGPYFIKKLCALFDKQPQELDLGVDQRKISKEGHAPSLQNSHPSLSTLDQGVTQLCAPYQDNPFLTGREDVLQQLVTGLCTRQSRNWTITGLPGVGKTSLAIALAHHPQIQERFRDGILWVGLGPEPQLAEAMNHWGTLLGISSTELKAFTTIDSMARALHQRLSDRQMLLILDDAWKLSDAVPFQVGGSQCAHVLTTRSPLLAYTFAREHVISLQPLSEAASAQLLQKLAPLTAQHYPVELKALAQPIGGLPLALTLLGRSLQVQSLHGSPRRLLQTLQHLRQSVQARFEVAEPLSVEDASPGYPIGTERSLHMAIDLSVHQLPPAAQCALHALSVFAPKPQSFTEEAALAICNTAPSVFDVLVDSGLVELCQTGRYQIHQTIFDYARLQGPNPDAEERLIDFFVQFVEMHHQDMYALDQDLHLITAAFALAFARRKYPLVLRGIFTLQSFIEQRRLYLLAETLCEWAEQAALHLIDQRSLAQMWLFRGKMDELRGEFQQAQHAYFEGLALARENQQQDVLPELLVLAGGTLIDTEVRSQAEAYLLESLRFMEHMEDDTPRSRVFQYLGELADNLGKTAEAQAFYQRGLTISRQTQNWKTASALLQDLGSQAVRHGDYTQASAYYEDGLNYARQLGDLQRQSALLMNMGMLAWYQQHWEKAVRLSEESLTLAREIGHQMRISSVLQNLGMMMRHQDQEAIAEHYLTESLELAQRIGHRWLICETLGEVGLLALKQRQTARAKHIFDEMRQQAQELQAPLLLGQAFFGFAQVAEQAGERSEALSAAQESLAILTKLDNHIMIQEIKTWLATLA